MRRILPILLLLFAAPVWAAEPDAKTDAKAGAPGTNIDMPFLMAPLNGANGKLAAYAYISSRVTANSDSSANEVRDKIAFIQDVFVRDVNGPSIGTWPPPIGTLGPVGIGPVAGPTGALGGGLNWSTRSGARLRARSRKKVAALLSRVLAKGQRNL